MVLTSHLHRLAYLNCILWFYMSVRCIGLPELACLRAIGAPPPLKVKATENNFPASKVVTADFMFLIALLFFQNPRVTQWVHDRLYGTFTSGGWLSLLRCNVGSSTPAPNRHQNCGDWPAAGTVLGTRDLRAGPGAVWCESKHVSPAHGTYMRFSGARMPSTSHHSFNVNLAKTGILV